jgi:hypothetical protein
MTEPEVTKESCPIIIYAIIPTKNIRITPLTSLITATVFPLFDIPKANPKNTATGIRYANSPNNPNKMLLIAVAAAPCIIPTTHRNAKIATAKITMSMTSFFIATSTVFLVFLPCDFLVPEPDVLFLVLELALELVLELVVLDLDVFLRLRDALLPDACAISDSPN